jgi:hypothetical protein
VNNLKQQGIAIHAFHDAKQKLPSSVRPTAASTVRAGAFVLLLPYIDHKDFWDMYDLNVTWSHANNLPVSNKRVATFECPSSPTQGNKDHNPDGVSAGSPWVPIVAVGDYGASLGNHPDLVSFAAGLSPPIPVQASALPTSTAEKPTNGFLPKNAEIKLSHITDGVSNTIAILESAGRPLVYRGSSPVGQDPAVNRVNAGGWVRPASDILFTGSDITGSSFPGAYVNRTNGRDVGAESYGASGYPSVGTEGSSQPFAFHSAGFNALLGDGSVRLIRDDINLGIICALISRNGAGKDSTGNLKETILDSGAF